jgi:hypothetical protein
MRISKVASPEKETGYFAHVPTPPSGGSDTASVWQLKNAVAPGRGLAVAEKRMRRRSPSEQLPTMVHGPEASPVACAGST